jgi:hypothetical protein
MTDVPTLTTRIGLGTSRQLRIETNDPQVYGRFKKGIYAEYEAADHAISIFAADKGGSHFHVHGDNHLTSILVLETPTFEDLDPFRIVAPTEINARDFEGEIRFYLPEKLLPPKGYNRGTRDESNGRTRHPLSPLTVEEVFAMRDKTDFDHFDPRVFNQLLRLAKDYSAEHDIRLCLDEHGELYGRIDGR